MKRFIAIVCVCFLAGCQTQPPVPADFIIKPTLSDKQAISIVTNKSPDYIIQYSSGQTRLSTQEKNNLLNWLNKLPIDSTIVIHGGAGAIKYESTGIKRQQSTYDSIAHLQRNFVLLPYNPNLPGRQTQIWAISADETQITNGLLIHTILNRHIPIKTAHSKEKKLNTSYPTDNYETAPTAK